MFFILPRNPFVAPLAFAGAAAATGITVGAGVDCTVF